MANPPKLTEEQRLQAERYRVEICGSPEFQKFKEEFNNKMIKKGFISREAFEKYKREDKVKEDDKL